MTSRTKKWSKEVTEHSDALDLDQGLFELDDPAKIAASLKRSAEHSKRRKGTPLQSAMSMLTFYINRAGDNLSAERRHILEQAKDEVRARFVRRGAMPQGDKSSYSDKQKRKAEHVEQSYEERGASKKDAESHAWATVNKESGGGKKSGSGRGKRESHVSSARGGRAQKPGSAEQRSAAARKGWDTRRRNAQA